MNMIALAIGTLSGTLMVLGYALWYGYRARCARIKAPEVAGELRSMHMVMIGFFVVGLLISIYVVERVVNANGSLWGPIWLLMIHFILVILFALSLLGTIVLWNGVRRRDLHWRVARITIALFFATAVTGGYLFSLHPLLR